MKRFLRFFGLAPSGSPSASYTPPDEASSVLGAGLTLKGEIKGEGSIVILGSFEGDVVLEGTLHVGPEGRVDANISAAAIVIAGAVRGNIAAHTRVEILPTGALTGSVRSGSFAAADGAVVKGELWIEPPPASTTTP